MSRSRSRIISTGSYLPLRVVTNADIEKMVDTSDQWIMARTGIKERHMADAGQAVSDLAFEAAKTALGRAGMAATEIELILFATLTPDFLLPSSACILQHKLGAINAAAFDLNAACSGFVFGLSVADAYIRAGVFKRILLVGAEVLSKFTDWQDRNTCVLFGDGAGAVVIGMAEDEDDSAGRDNVDVAGVGAGVGLGRDNGDGAGRDICDGAGVGKGEDAGVGRGNGENVGQGKGRCKGPSCILSVDIHSDGALAELLYMPGGGSKNPPSHETVDARMHYIRMKGNETFKVAVRTLEKLVVDTVAKNGISASDIALLIPHQANMRIITATAERLGLPMDRVMINLDRCGNTSAASIPIALDEAVTTGRVKRGDYLLLEAFGGGLTWASALVRW
jgi:3-oxoacyl-[acyl-carrier-protein] synthase-3